MELLWNNRTACNGHCISHKMTNFRFNLPWFNCSLRRQARAKQRLYNKAKVSGNKAQSEKFRATKKRVHQSLNSVRNVYISDYLGEAIETNPKRLWSFMKQKKHDHRFADFEIIRSIISDGNCKAEILHEHFSSVFISQTKTSQISQM